MSDYILWGATGQAIVIEEILRSQNSKILALFDNNRNLRSPFKDVPLYFGNAGLDEWLMGCNNPNDINFLIAIGGSNSESRENVYNYLLSKGLCPQTLIHDTAFVSYNARLGKGVQILANSSICANVVIGDSVIINTSSSIDHESVIGEFSHIAPGSVICGLVEIGKRVFIGANSTVLPRISIGNNSIIGAGSVVTKDIPQNVIAYGNPARVIKIID